MDGHSTARGRLYYLLTLKIITGRLARAECGVARVEDLTTYFSIIDTICEGAVIKIRQIKTKANTNKSNLVIVKKELRVFSIILM